MWFQGKDIVPNMLEKLKRTLDKGLHTEILLTGSILGPLLFNIDINDLFYSSPDIEIIPRLHSVTQLTTSSKS